ncbi:MAG: DUF2304 family protein [bacterium]|nr:DUF2304 family protein [bacterium]
MAIQLLISIIAGLVIINAISKLRQKNFTLPIFVVWISLWGAMGFAVWYPNISNIVAQVLHVGRGADAVFYLSIILIFYLLFRIYARMERIHQNLTRLTRAVAIASKKDKQ